jgi:hypothetical protein
MKSELNISHYIYVKPQILYADDDVLIFFLVSHKNLITNISYLLQWFAAIWFQLLASKFNTLLKTTCSKFCEAPFP